MACSSGLCGTITTVIGAILVVVFSVVGFVVVPNILTDIITNEVALIANTTQMERFEVIPFPLNFSVRFFNVANADEVINGATPVLQEVGPYIYRLYRRRVVLDMDEDSISYQIVENYEFDREASYPYDENDLVTIVNVPFHAILQQAEVTAANLLFVLNQFIGSIFGSNASPYATLRVGDILFDGVPICENPSILARPICTIIRNTAADTENIIVHDNGSMSFSLFAHKNGHPGNVYKADRGLNSVNNLGLIMEWDGSSRLNFWPNQTDENGNDEISACNHVNGTDTAIYPPFVDTSRPLYGFNPDICRSVELRYERDEMYENIPAKRFSAEEWFLDNDDGCFCVNATPGVTQPNGCLYRGAMELYSCVGGFMVLSNPHFTFTDEIYQNAVSGLNPTPEIHKIYMDIEPNSGIVIRGSKRAQFNIFARPIQGISSTQNIVTTLTPIFWVEEGMSLPEELVDEITSSLLRPLRIVDIVRIALITLGGIVFVIGVIFLMKSCI